MQHRSCHSNLLYTDRQVLAADANADAINDNGGLWVRITHAVDTTKGKAKPQGAAEANKRGIRSKGTRRVLATAGDVNIGEPGNSLCTRHVPLYPNKAKRQWLRRLCNEYRKTYNNCVQWQNSRKWQESWAARRILLADKWIAEGDTKLEKAQQALDTRTAVWNEICKSARQRQQAEEQRAEDDDDISPEDRHNYALFLDELNADLSADIRAGDACAILNRMWRPEEQQRATLLKEHADATKAMKLNDYKAAEQNRDRALAYKAAEELAAEEPTQNACFYKAYYVGASLKHGEIIAKVKRTAKQKKNKAKPPARQKKNKAKRAPKSDKTKVPAWVYDNAVHEFMDACKGLVASKTLSRALTFKRRADGVSMALPLRELFEESKETGVGVELFNNMRVGHAGVPNTVDLTWNEHIKFVRRGSEGPRGLRAALWGTENFGVATNGQSMEHPRSLRLLENNRGHFFFIITRMVSGAATPEAVTTNAGNRHLTVALDPGVRTFQTAYDADGRAIHFGEGAGHKLVRMFAHADRLQGKWKAAEHGSKAAKVLYHKWRRCMSKVTRRVRSMHQRTAAWLLSNYRVVLVSNMNTSAMVRTGGILRPATRRGMLQLSHYRFRQVLLSMARRYKDCRVIEVSEHYTSMSCGACGMKNRGLFGSKTFVCPYCNFECDRDVNGARNILLKYLCDVEIPLANGTPLPGAKERREAKRQAAKRKTAASSQTQGAAKRK